MSILTLPGGNEPPSLMICAICTGQITPETAMFGPSRSDGTITMICQDHFHNSMRFISMMADYIAEERLKQRSNRVPVAI